MPKTGENIRKRKDGRWEARIIVKSNLGQTKSISVYGKSYREVKNKKINFQMEDYSAKKVKGTNLENVINEWLLNNFLYQKKATILKYKVIVKNHILPALGKYDINDLDETIINSFLVKKISDGRLDHKGGLSSSYVKTMGIVLNSIINYAVAQGYCAPLKTKIAKPVIAKKEITVLDLKMQLRLEHQLEFDDSLTALGIFIALNTGMRIGEICGLKWADIDLDNRVIRIRHTVARVESASMSFDSSKTCLILDKPKTKTSIRDIPITSKLLLVLEKAIKSRVSEFVVSEKSNFVSPRTFEYRYHKVLEQYGVPRMNFHCLRHTFATRCIELSVDVKTLSEILGHANVGITLNTYVHSSIDLKRSQIEKLSTLEQLSP